ncbi:hypothetical protein BD779DRAFT_1550353 [Infundibulicybe gibba]|nr:hypothetical protein BD779DRAFT_1550353 [Infundibulicybe gibba]
MVSCLFLGASALFTVTITKRGMLILETLHPLLSVAGGLSMPWSRYAKYFSIHEPGVVLSTSAVDFHPTALQAPAPS